MFDDITVKCVVIGDSGVGKTSLLYSYADNILPTDDFVPTIFESRTERVLVDGKEVALSLWDNSEIKDCSPLKPIIYPNTDIFVICFSLSSHDSFKNVYAKWLPEVTRFSPESLIILAGTKLDMCEGRACVTGNEDFKPVTMEQGVEMAKLIKAVKYVECSAITGVGLKKVFDEVCRAHLQKLCRARLKKKDDFTCAACVVS